MLEPITAFIGLVGALVGVGKDSFGLYENIKVLFKSPGLPILLEFGNVGKREKEGIEQAYQLIEKIRPRAEGIARKIRNRYMFLAILVVLAWAGISVMFLILGVPFGRFNLVGKMFFLYLLLMAGFVSSKLLGKPLSRLPEHRAGNQEVEFSGVMRAYVEMGRESKRLMVRGLSIGRLTVSEKDLLEQFLGLEAMISCLETYFIAKRLEISKSALWESFSRNIMQIASSTIRTLVDEGRLVSITSPETTPETQREILHEEFRNAGLEDLIDPKLVGQDFFRPDLVALARSENPRALEAHLERSWPVRARV
jgi:hypothetical protein